MSQSARSSALDRLGVVGSAFVLWFFVFSATSHAQPPPAASPSATKPLSAALEARIVELERKFAEMQKEESQKAKTSPGGDSTEPASKPITWKQPPVPPRKPVPVEALTRSLKFSLGDQFEFLGSEIAWTGTGDRQGDRYWIAKVRPKVAGAFALEYRVDFDYSATLEKYPLPGPKQSLYFWPIRVGERGTPRTIRYGAYRGTVYPHANIGDTILLPMMVEWFIAEIAFLPVSEHEPAFESYFGLEKEEPQLAEQKQPTRPPPAIVNPADEKLRVLSSSGFSMRFPGGGQGIGTNIFAKLEFKSPGEYNLAATLTGSEDNFRSDGYSFRVVPQDQPVQVIPDHLQRQDGSGPFRHGNKVDFPRRTTEVRVGDRVSIECGFYGEQSVSVETIPG